MSDEETRPGLSLEAATTARRELHAANTLLGDPAAHPSTVAPHLEAAAEALGSTQAQGVDLEPTRAKLRRRARDLGRALRSAEAGVQGGKLLRRRRIAWGAVSLALVAAPVAVWVASQGPLPGRGPWRGQYFGNRSLEGDPVVVRDDAVDFRWKSRAPLEQIAPDEFSIRWDTCLRMDESAEVIFQLTSDDGSRLFIDGERVINNWGKHKTRARKGKPTLEAGVHHLRVEYQDISGAALVHLYASFEGEKPAPLDAARLSYPGDDFDEADPCRKHR